MSCLTPEQIDLHARGTLDAALAADVEAHLQQCAACRRKIEQARRGEELLGKIKDLPESAHPSSVAAEAGSGVQTVPADASALPLFSSPPPDSFAGYQIIREIHRGGQGIVYQAIQKSTKRRVALKVLKEGPFATPSERARFEREVTILGQLSHPNIVTVHDSGESAGYFYFVMDYISGQPLDVWMASGERSVEETLRLFAKICEAVNAAHLHGIIHRDLKPGNIRIDPEGQPHVLDFGLAKMAVGQMSNGSQPLMMTVTGQFMGSLPWASPEQAEAAPGKVDIRTDVYSLGVILYQMLTSKFPYDVIGNMRDVLDRILKTEPAKPSTFRVASPRSKGVASAPRHDVASAPRGRRRGQVPNRIGDEVDTIVLKCLSKERERRYQTAGELARDIGHYLQGEPIEAKRDSALYVLRKTLRRYKVPVAVAAMFALVVSAGLVVSLMLWRQAVAERAGAIAAKQAEIEQRRVAQQQAAEADRQRRTAEGESYVANLYAADASLMTNEPARARARLDACPARLRGWEWGWLNARSDDSLAVLRGHEDRVHSAAFSPDGTRIVTASTDKTARVWDASSGQELAVLRGHEDQVLSAAYSPDGTRIVTASRDRSARVWDASSGRELAALHGHEDWLFSAAFSPDGTRIVTASRDRTARVWDASSGQELAALRGHEYDVVSAAFSPDGTRIVTAGNDRTARVWDSVPYRERFPAIEAVRKAEPAMKELVSRRLTAGEDASALAESLAKDRVLTEPQRVAALAALQAERDRRVADEARARRDRDEAKSIIAGAPTSAPTSAPSTAPASPPSTDPTESANE